MAEMGTRSRCPYDAEAGAGRFGTIGVRGQARVGGRHKVPGKGIRPYNFPFSPAGGFAVSPGIYPRAAKKWTTR